MIALPSIAFDGFSGSAKDVTARNVGGRTILSVKYYSKQAASPAQIARRTSFAKITREYKNLSDEQMRSWEALATKMKSQSVFGQTADLTGHNAFIRINTQLCMAGSPMAYDAPSQAEFIPMVTCSDYWVREDKITFIGIEQPNPDLKLVLKMSKGQKVGTSNGWSKSVIISPNIVPNWGDVDAIELYTSVLGVAPVEGQKYFIEMYWMDAKTGFTGESLRLSSLCSPLSNVAKVEYRPQPRISSKDLGASETLPSYNIAIQGGTAHYSAEIDYIGQSGISSAFIELPKGTITNIPDFDSYILGRAYDDAFSASDYFGPIMFEVWFRRYSSSDRLTFAYRCGHYSKECEIFGSGILIKKK